jgi:hypothetical protein
MKSATRKRVLPKWILLDVVGRLTPSKNGNQAIHKKHQLEHLNVYSSQVEHQTKNFLSTRQFHA